MRISDWSSDVCSSDLEGGAVIDAGQVVRGDGERRGGDGQIRALLGERIIVRCRQAAQRDRVRSDNAGGRGVGRQLAGQRIALDQLGGRVGQARVVVGSDGRRGGEECGGKGSCRWAT